MEVERKEGRKEELSENSVRRGRTERKEKRKKGNESREEQCERRKKGRPDQQPLLNT